MLFAIQASVKLNVKVWPQHCLLISLTPACGCKPAISVWQSITLYNLFGRLAFSVDHADCEATTVLSVSWQACEPVAGL